MGMVQRFVISVRSNTGYLTNDVVRKRRTFLRSSPLDLLLQVDNFFDSFVHFIFAIQGMNIGFPDMRILFRV